MRQRLLCRVRLLVFVAWLTLTVGLYAWMLLGTAERGSSFGSGILSAIAMVVGILTGFAGLMVMSRRDTGPDHRRLTALLMMMISITLVGLYPVHRSGRSLYLQDQSDARRFIERRLAAADELHRNTGKWPADQRAFLGDEPLPRMMQYHWFHYRPALPDGFELYINIDFDGGWHLTHERRDWRRST